MNLIVHIGGKPVTLENVVRNSQGCSFTLDAAPYIFRRHALPGGEFLLEREIMPGVWQRSSATAWQGRDSRFVQVNGIEAKVTEAAPKAAVAEKVPLSPPAPMSGLVRQMLVKPGDSVKQGQALAVMEAMKLQMTLTAGADATVEAVLARVGETIAEGAELVRLVPLKTGKS